VKSSHAPPEMPTATSQPGGGWRSSSQDCGKCGSEHGQSVPVCMEPAKTSQSGKSPPGPHAGTAVDMACRHDGYHSQMGPCQTRYPSIVPEDFCPPPSFPIALAYLRRAVIIRDIDGWTVIAARKTSLICDPVGACDLPL
jgi:hypothetical protein